MKAFWEVDCQVDFIDEDGKLSIPNAREITPRIGWITQVAHINNILIISSMDDHFSNDEELKHFPEHCMHNSTGQQRIHWVNLDGVNCKGTPDIYVPDKLNEFGAFYKLTYEDMVNVVKGNYKRITFYKQYTNVFTNPNCARILDKLDVREAVVYGVATDYCVKDAVLGLLMRGIKVYLVKDAIKELADEKKAIKLMVSKGAQLVSTKDVIKDL